MDDQDLCIPDVGEMTHELRRFDERLAHVASPADAEGEDRACAHRQVPAGQSVVGARFEARVTGERRNVLPGKQTDTFGLNRRVRLNAALASVISIIDSADARPTVQARALAEEYMARIDDELERLDALLDHDLAAFNRLVAEANLLPVDPS